MVRKETTRSPSLTRTLDADTKAKDISNKTMVEEGIKEEEDTKTKEVAVTKDTKEEEDSKVVVAEAIIRVAVSEEEAVAMVMISIINKVAVIVVLLQPIRRDSLIGTTTITSILI